ncbi:hypothetical protein D3C84_1268220 [compost metagenome]
MPKVVAFELELGTVTFTQLFDDILDVTERVAENEIAGAVEEGWLPVVKPLRMLALHWENAEVH